MPRLCENGKLTGCNLIIQKELGIFYHMWNRNILVWNLKIRGSSAKVWIMLIQISYQLIEYNVVCLLMTSLSKHEATFYYQVLTNTGFWWSGWQILMLFLGWQKHLNTKAGNLKWSWLIYIAKEICIRIFFSLEKKRNFYILVFFPITTDNLMQNLEFPGLASLTELSYISKGVHCQWSLYVSFTLTHNF